MTFIRAIQRPKLTHEEKRAKVKEQNVKLQSMIKIFMENVHANDDKAKKYRS